MRSVEFRLQGDRLLHGGAPARKLMPADFKAFADWGATYHALAWRPDAQPGLLALGRQIHDWLDGSERWIARLRQTPSGGLLPIFATDFPADDAARHFLDVPWELAADEAGYLAQLAPVRWAPLRRVGPAAAPPEPAGKFRLSALFMAAAPIGPDALDFEAEERAILRATERLGLDLHVEDSGTLAELAEHWARLGSPEILHLSCHGTGGTAPALVLEGPGGERRDATLDQMVEAFGASWPKLLILSACHTGQGAADDALAVSLVGAGCPAVLSWADSVYDGDATDFAATLYAELAKPNTLLASAYAQARFALLRPRPDRPIPAHWHQARLFLGLEGGGKLAGGTLARLRAGPDAGHKTLVEARGGTIEVASRFEFVGRRRQIQAIRRAFAPPAPSAVLIHALGRQGKSSLAARIMDRYPELTPVVLYQTCDGPSLLDEIAHKVTTEGVAALCRDYRAVVDPNNGPAYDPTALYRVLRQLLTGPLGAAGILLVVDDFEALLEAAPRVGLHRLRPAAIPGVAAAIEAFSPGDTPSRLLITSRHKFALDQNGRNLAGRLVPISLPEMSISDSVKQARQKLYAAGPAPPEFDALLPRAIAAARGNAGLQDILFRAILADPRIGETAIAALEAYLAGGTLPGQQELRDTLEELLIDRLTGVLTEGERQLLAASTLFRLPVPLALWTGFAERAGYEKPDRLLGFGLWEQGEDPVEPGRIAVRPNAIAVARLPPADLAPQIAAALLDDLLAAWGGADRASAPPTTDIELSRLALDFGNPTVLAATAANAVFALERRFDYATAKGHAIAALDCLERFRRAVPIDLFRAAAQVFDHFGEAERLARIYRDCGALLAADNSSLPNEERRARAQLRSGYGTYLWQQGDPDQGLRQLEAAHAAFEALGDRRSRAVTLGDIARIRTDKGEVDAALELHNERLATYEALGDRRSRAVTLGDIARIRTDKGEVDAALELHNERLATYEALGDRRSRAVTLGDIARIRRDKGEVDAALELHMEELATYEALGDRRSRAVTLGDIARIRTDKGEVDAALELHREQLAMFDALGDRRSRAVTLGDIARIRRDKGEVDAALELHMEELATYEALGDRRSRAVTLGDIARIRRAKGEVDAALELHRERLAMFEALGDRRERAVTLGDIARIRTDKGEVDAALELHREQLAMFEALGDRRSRAVTLGDIARIRTAKGEVDAALALQEERLKENRTLGDQDGIAAASYDIGTIHLARAMEQEDSSAFARAAEALSESYGILLRIGRLDGICAVGTEFGRVLAMAGQIDDARTVLTRSLDGFRKLGYAGPAARVEAILRSLG